MAKTHVIDGVTYVEVERKAKIGDYVLYSNLGAIYKVDRLPRKRDDNCLTIVYTKHTDLIGKPAFTDSLDFFKVIEPLPEEVTVDTSQASEQVIEMFAALSRKIVSLERQLADTQRNVERQAEELENAKHRIQKHATMFGSVEEKVEMLTSDVITLDERTQVINAITKFYEEAQR